MSIGRILPLAAACAAIFGTLLFPTAGSQSGDPADFSVSVPPVRYQPVLQGWPVEPYDARPADWLQLNDLAKRVGGPLGQLKDPGAPLKGEQL